MLFFIILVVAVVIIVIVCNKKKTTSTVNTNAEATKTVNEQTPEGNDLDEKVADIPYIRKNLLTKTNGIFISSLSLLLIS